MSDPIWITEQEVVDLMSLPQAIDALRNGLREEALGRAANMTKTHAVWGGHSTLHAIGAVMDGRGVVGTKTWAHTERGAMPLLILIDSNDGSVLAIVEAFALGQMRTGGISGLAADVMAKPDARHMAIIGSGKQSITQIAAVAAVRALDRVTVWSPTPANREALAQQVNDRLKIASVATATLEEAIDGADVVTLATRAKEPFISRDMMATGTHINAVGAILPDRIEFAPDLLERTAIISADAVPQVRKLSREYMEFFGEDEQAWAKVRPLSGLVLASATRPADADLTIFKAMGMGISDLSLGVALLASAREAGIGRPIPRPGRATPRLTDA
ncbi:MAG: ornithine cyclodeaminase family protein [Sphingomonadaceae bacterium]|jgi:ornithine cyclodeaminase